jgi:glycosyltransferase involved in cell wall biosynthesis
MGLALALSSVGVNVRVISDGISSSAGFSKVWHPSSIECDRGIVIVTLPAVGLPLLGALLSPFCYIGILLEIIRAGRKGSIIFYNYSLMYLLIMSVLRVTGGISVLDLEDITALRYSDLGKFKLALIRLINLVSMKTCLRLANKVILPCRSFYVQVPKGKPSQVMEYCVPNDIIALQETSWSDKVQVLFAGPYQRDHGILMLQNAIQTLEKRKSLGYFHFHFCGKERLPKQLQEIASRYSDCISCHGFLSRTEYLALLQRSQVGLALQLRDGLYGRTNTPSKAYEWLSAGKLVIACEVGGLSTLDGDKIVILRQETSEELAHILEDIRLNRNRYGRILSTARAYSRQTWATDVQGSRLAEFIVPS